MSQMSSQQKNGEMGTKKSQSYSPGKAEQVARLVLSGEMIVATNQAALSLLMSKRDELLGQSFLTYSVAEQTRGRLSADSLRLRCVAALAGQPQRFNWTLSLTDGTRVRTQISMEQVRAKGKSFVQLSLEPIAVKDEAQQALLMFRLGIERTNDAIFLTNTEGHIIYTNPAFEQIYGYSQEDSIGQTPRILKSGELPDEIYKDFWYRLLNKEVVAGEIINRTKDGRLILIEGSNNPILDEEGNLIGFLAIHRDASQRKRADGVLKEANEELELRVEERTGELARVNVLLQEQYDEIALVKVELEQRNLTLETLNELSIKAASSLNPEDIFQQVIYFTGQLIDCTSAYLSTFDLENRSTTVVAEYIGPEANDNEHISDLGTSYKLAEEFGDTRESSSTLDEIIVIQADDKQATAEEQVLIGRNEAKSILTIVLTAAGEPVAKVEFLESRRKRKFEEDEIELVQAVARQIALPIKNARLYQQAMHEIQEREALEQQIQESFERRGRQVRLSAQLSKDIIAATGLADLYQRVVTHVKDQFGFYHTQLLRYEPSLDSIALIAGYGEVGRQMLQDRFTIPMDIGLIGTAAATGKSALLPDVSTAPNWQSNPLLAETKGELVVPIILGDEVLGVLDVQSDRANALSIDDQLALEGLCAQIAIAIESTHLRQNLEERLQELNHLQRIMSHEGWQSYRSQRDAGLKGYRFDRASVEEVEGATRKTVTGFLQAAWDSKPPAATDEEVFSTPMKVRGEIIGALGIRDDPDQPLTTEDRELLDSITVQVAEALETARLLEQTQIHALEMEAVAQVSAAASSILDTDRLLRTVTDLTKDRFVLLHAAVYVVDGEVLRLAASSLITEEMLATNNVSEINMSQSESLIALAAKARQAMVVNDVSIEPNYVAYPTLPAAHSELAIPLLLGDEVLGVLDLLAENVNRFTEDEVRIHTTLGAQVAVALQNAWLYAEQLETAKRLREVDRLKSEFLASMSHELRTPLNSIIGFSDVLLEGIDGPLNSRMEEDVSLIRDSGRHLRTLISEMLDMSKIEAGVMELHYEEVDIPSLAEDIIANAINLGKGKDLKFNLVLDPTLKKIYADRTRLTQILLNLLSNAIKFTEKGSITLQMEQKMGDLQCSVTDTGIGIHDDDLPVIFEQFRQIDGSLTRRAGGTGLGIPISRSLVELHGGKLHVESKPGEGSVFSFTIPGNIEEPVPSGVKRIMVIEDNQSNMTLIARVVEAEGYDLIQVEDGKKAMELLADEIPDLILLDINIPGIHGLDLARQLKADERLAKVPLVATTANVLLGDRERCIEAGCDNYLPKPLDISKLREMMRDYLENPI